MWTRFLAYSNLTKKERLLPRYCWLEASLSGNVDSEACPCQAFEEALIALGGTNFSNSDLVDIFNKLDLDGGGTIESV